MLLIETAVGTLEQHKKKSTISLRTAKIQKALLDGNMQKWYSIFPSIDPQEGVRDMMARIHEQWVPRLSAIGAYHGLADAIETHWLSTGSPESDQAMVTDLRQFSLQ